MKETGPIPIPHRSGVLKFVGVSLESGNGKSHEPILKCSRTSMEWNNETPNSVFLRAGGVHLDRRRPFVQRPAAGNVLAPVIFFRYHAAADSRPNREEFSLVL